MVEDSMPMSTLDDELFVTGQVKRRLTRSEKRADRREYCPEEVKESESVKTEVRHALDIPREEMKMLQSTDVTLKKVKDAVEHPSRADAKYFRRDGLLYRRWIPPKKDETMIIEQLVLPLQCRKTVLEPAHSTPLAGHMGKDKTANRILQRFYWPTLYKDVEELCRTCAICQTTSLAEHR